MSLVLYGIPLSPFVRKVDVCLREKGVEFELESVSIMPMPDWFKEISPARRIPVLRDTSVGQEGALGTIPDSSAICAYLERIHPETPLYPSDPFEYARALWYEEYCDTELIAQIGPGIFRAIQFPRFSGDEPDLDKARHVWREKLPPLFDYLEGEIGDREFLAGDQLSIADISLACHMVQLDLVAGLPSAEKWPSLVAFVERMKARPSFGPALEICRKIVKQEPVDLDS